MLICPLLCKKPRYSVGAAAGIGADASDARAVDASAPVAVGPALRSGMGVPANRSPRAPDCSSIAVAAGTNYEDFLQSAGFPASRIHPTQNTSEAIQEVHDGKAVGTIVGNVLFSDSQSPDYCDLTMVGPPLAPDNWGFVFRNSLSSVFMNQVFPACTMQAHALIDYPDRRSHIEAPAHGEDRKYDRGNPQNPMHKGVPCKAT